MSLTGHSDADAVAHAITDALLGATALGDIGALYPDSDAANKDRDSIAMLAAVRYHLRDAGWTVVNVDVTVVCEEPKIAAQRDAMRHTLATALGVLDDAVWVKGKTNERMGWIRSRRGDRRGCSSSRYSRIAPCGQAGRNHRRTIAAYALCAVGADDIH